jgi:phosphocarrier protein HPr
MKKLFGLLGLNIKQGDRVTVTLEGADEAAAAAALKSFLENNL